MKKLKVSVNVTFTTYIYVTEHENEEDEIDYKLQPLKNAIFDFRPVEWHAEIDKPKVELQYAK